MKTKKIWEFIITNYILLLKFWINCIEEFTQALAIYKCFGSINP